MKKEVIGLNVKFRLVTPLVSEDFRRSCESLNNEEKMREFERAKLLVSHADLKLGDIIGHGEFGGKLHSLNFV